MVELSIRVRVTTGIVLLALAASVSSAPVARADGEAPVGAPGGTPAPTVPTEDQILQVTSLEAQVKGHVEEKAADAMRQDLLDIMKLLPTVQDAKLRGRVTALVPKILNATKEPILVKAALKALGDTADTSLFKYLRPYLQQQNPKEVGPYLLDAIEVAGKLKADDAVPVLLKIVEDSKRLEAATAAMKALGNFGASKRMRERIVTDLVLTTRKDVPGVAYSKDGDDPSKHYPKAKTGEDARTRWEALSGALTPALNQLTGQNCASAMDWFALYDNYKGKLGKLFTS